MSSRRQFTHRGFKTAHPLRIILGMLGSAAVEGPLISWLADLRQRQDRRYPRSASIRR